MSFPASINQICWSISFSCPLIPLQRKWSVRSTYTYTSTSSLSLSHASSLHTLYLPSTQTNWQTQPHSLTPTLSIIRTQPFFLSISLSLSLAHLLTYLKNPPIHIHTHTRANKLPLSLSCHTLFLSIFLMYTITLSFSLGDTHPVSSLDTHTGTHAGGHLQTNRRDWLQRLWDNHPIIDRERATANNLRKKTF